MNRDTLYTTVPIQIDSCSLNLDTNLKVRVCNPHTKLYFTANCVVKVIRPFI